VPARAGGYLTLEELERLIRDREIDTVVVAICDMQGRLMGKRVRGDFFLEHCREHGTHFCTYLLGTDMEMTTPDGYALMNWESGYGDWQAKPDYGTLRRIPWQERTAMVLADVADEESGQWIPIAPRTILRRQVEKALAMGFQPKMASELEFYLLRETYEQAWDKGFVNLERFGRYNEDYNLLQGTKAEPLYRQLRNLMAEAAIPVEFSKGEAAPGQHEVNIHYDDALESADRHALFKHGAKELAILNNCAITFMAKPDHTWTGSSCHVHISLWDKNGGSNLFHDPDGAPYQLSRTARHFLGGLIACARELSLFVAGNINSYKRYATASWAPVHIVWGRDNRTCGLRVVGHGRSLRVENRFPGGDANPYLTYAAVLAAGLYGIERELEPPEEYRGNAYAATGAPRVPRSLYEAIAAWEQSNTARALFGDDVVEHYLNMARVEQASYDAAVTTWERERYFERG
jgi:glutamine synthetase